MNLKACTRHYRISQVKVKTVLDEARLEMHWKNYAMKAEHYENLLVPRLQKLFRSQQVEAINNLKEGKQEHLIDLGAAESAFIEVAFPVLEDQILKAVQDARDLVKPRNPHKAQKADPSIEAIADHAAIEWLKTRMGWVAAEFCDETERKLAQTLAQGFGEGESIPKLTKRIKAVFNWNENVRARLIARTETIAASAQGALEGYKEVGVGRVQFYTALDARSELGCDCPSLHGKDFPVADSINLIPLHPNCRCVWIPVVEGD